MNTPRWNETAPTSPDRSSLRVAIKYNPEHRKTMRRVEVPLCGRYLTMSCYHRLALFGNNAIKREFIGALAEARQVHGFLIFAWVIMPEHLHLMLMPSPPEESLVHALWDLKRAFAKTLVSRWRELRAPILARITDKNGRVRFWQPGGGYDRLTFTSDELIEKVRYIHKNPVRRGLVEQPAEWPWSSARWYEGCRDGELPIDSIYDFQWK